MRRVRLARQLLRLTEARIVDTANFETVLATVDGVRGALTLNRPEKLNPLSSHTLHEIEQSARWFDEHHDLKVVVVSGAGRSFSAGADLSAFSTAAPMEDRQAGWRMGRALDEMRAVTVASLRGWCIGGGLIVAAGCDLRIAADTAAFRFLRWTLASRSHGVEFRGWYERSVLRSPRNW